MNPEIIGFLAAILTTIAYIPQTVKVFRDKHTASLSLGMYCLLTTGIFCWLIYGIMLGSWSLIAANGITFCMALAILCMKIKHG